MEKSGGAGKREKPRKEDARVELGRGSDACRRQKEWDRGVEEVPPRDWRDKEREKE